MICCKLHRRRKICIYLYVCVCDILSIWATVCVGVFVCVFIWRVARVVSTTMCFNPLKRLEYLWWQKLSGYPQIQKGNIVSLTCCCIQMHLVPFFVFFCSKGFAISCKSYIHFCHPPNTREMNELLCASHCFGKLNIFTVYVLAFWIFLHFKIPKPICDFQQDDDGDDVSQSRAALISVL